MNPTEAITVETWIKLDIAASEGTLYAPIIRRNSTYLLRADKKNSGVSFNIFIYYGTSWEPGAYSVSHFDFGVWYHIVGTYDRQHVKIYVNGKLKGSSARTGAIQSSAENTIVGFWNNKYFPGFIDEVRVYNRALSAEEIKNLYFAGKPN